MFQTEQQAIEEQDQDLLRRQRDSPCRPGVEADPLQRGMGHLHFVFCHSGGRSALRGKKWSFRSAPRKLPSRSKMPWAAQAGISRVEAVKGYLNLYFDTAEYARRVVDAVLEQKDRFGSGAATGQRVMVEFSQPNTHKAFHVGHLRAAILGDALAGSSNLPGMRWCAPITPATWACTSSSGCGVI